MGEQKLGLLSFLGFCPGSSAGADGLSPSSLGEHQAPLRYHPKASQLVLAESEPRDRRLSATCF